MSELHFPNLHIHGFRGIKDLDIPCLGRVTLITGKNNTGKSSILEALHLHARNAIPPVIHHILSSREEYLEDLDKDSAIDQETYLPVSGLFHGFPLHSDSFENIVISTTGGPRTTPLTISMTWLSERLDDQDRWITDEAGALPGEFGSVPALVVETEVGKRVQRLSNFLGSNALALSLRSWNNDTATTPRCVLTGPYRGQRTSDLATLWDRIALTPQESEIVEALQIIEPNISAVSMLGRLRVLRRKKIHGPDQKPHQADPPEIVRRWDNLPVRHDPVPRQRSGRNPAHRRVREWPALQHSNGCLEDDFPAGTKTQRTGLRHHPQLGCNRGLSDSGCR